MPTGDDWGAAFAESHLRWGKMDTQEALVVGAGYHPDIPDNRDLQMGNGNFDKKLANVFGGQAVPPLLLGIQAPPPDIDLITQHGLKDVWPVEDQRQLNSCTAHAVVGLVEFLLQVLKTDSIDLSRLFLYSMTRRLLGLSGDSGASIRGTIKALAAFGMPPEEYWPYDPAHFDADPTSFLYAYASGFKAITYMRLDGYAKPPQNQPVTSSGASSTSSTASSTSTSGKPPSLSVRPLRWLERVLAAGYPVAFGFPLYSCIRDSSPNIPFPKPLDRFIGGHAVLAVGYDKAKQHVKFRNSWGSSWGEDGYGYLPYRYFDEELTADLWTIFNQSWIV